jgi:hypothetical protein
VDQIPDVGVLAAQCIDMPGQGGLRGTQHGADGRVTGQGQPDRVECFWSLVRALRLLIAAQLGDRHRQHVGDARAADRVSAGQRRYGLLVAGVGFEPT